MYIVMTGINHKTAPIEIRERFTISKERINEALKFFKEISGAKECLILITCNRIELYAVYQNIPLRDKQPEIFFERFFYSVFKNLNKYLIKKSNEDAIRHLFRVSSSLDSMVVGESQILGQVKRFFFSALEIGTTGIIFNQLFRKAIECGKKVRSETKLGKLKLSVPHIVVEYINKKFKSISDKNIMLIGSGKIGALTAKHLKFKGVSNLFVVNRTFEKSLNLANKFDATPIKFNTDLNFLYTADIILSSTSAAHYIIKKTPLKKIMDKRKNKPLIIFDIAVPRDVEPNAASIPGVSLFNIDDLNEIIDNKAKRLRNEIASAEIVIEDELKIFNKWLENLDIVPVLNNFRTNLNDIKEKELKRIFKDNDHLTDEIKQKIEYYGTALINKIAHIPTRVMKKNQDSDKNMMYAEILSDLFELSINKSIEPETGKKKK